MQDRISSENDDELGLGDSLLLQIQNLANGNQVSKNDVKKISSQIFPFNTKIFVYWQFYGSYATQTLKGDASVDIHFGDNKIDFEEYTQSLLDLAQNDEQSRQDFVENLKATKANEAIKLSGSTQNLGDYEKFSFSYYCGSCSGRGLVRCNNCGGRGNVGCSSCGGSGRSNCFACGGTGSVLSYRQVYQNGEYVSQSYYATCYSCGGSGLQTCGSCYGSGSLRCNSCRGSGEITCQKCSGYGIFTDVRTVSIMAKSSANLKTSSKKYANEFDEFASSAGMELLSEKIPFELVEFNNYSSDTELCVYEGNSYFSELQYQILDKTYLGVGFANPPYAFIKSKFFDDLFADEIEHLEKIGLDGKITKREAYLFFNKYASQSVLDKSMKLIASIRRDKNEELGYAVKQSCDDYISDESALRLSAMMKGVLDRISPVYSGLIWGLGGAIFAIFALILTELNLESSFSRAPFSAIFQSAFGVFVLSLVLGLVFYTLSSLSTLLKRRKIPKEYRQKMRNKDPFKKMAICGVFAWIVGGIYGYFASQNPALRLENRVENFVLEQIEISEKFIKDYEICEKFKTLNCSNEILPAKNSEISPSYEQKVIFIQQTLRQNGYNVAIDGKFGKKTINACTKFLGKSFNSIDEIYDEMLRRNEGK
ncbi:hypothetical protein OFO12_07825 [Campylobacter sp. JMF_04 NA10]|uniref:hypothetical protein n=1 Tax=Campylobacter sp. JMF_04 NA10 TaxID=2983824 RepID=UPI0022EA009A|nr:hypothetical protein [Campylobacter sp. JMF_04 NA10]MDA3077264.1 hypothetical protein [Campylobacter sp. JMF_04 NA10]